MTIQQKMRSGLEGLGIPFRAIECYGSQIMVTAQSRDTASRWVSVLSKLCKTRKPRMFESVDYCAEDSQRSRNTLAPKIIRVWRVGGTI